MRNIRILICAMSLACAPAALMAEPADIGGALANPDRTEADRGEDEQRHSAEVLRFFGLEQGDRAFDYLTVGGYYSELMARAVGPEGMVLAHNPPRFIGEQLRAGIEARGYGTRLANAVSYEHEVDDIDFEPNSLDFALFANVFHDFWFRLSEDGPPVSADPAAFLAELYEGMSPGGTVGIVDHVGMADTDPEEEMTRAHRIEPADIRSMMEAAGFVFEGEADFLRNPQDDHSLSVFDEAIRGQTDRVVYRFRKPGDDS
jgi:predicted methyltransferase